MYEFDPVYIGTLVRGLRDDSRIKMAAIGSAVSIDRIISAYAADMAARIAWLLSENGTKIETAPGSMLNILLGEETPETTHGYSTPDEFFEAMKKYEVT